MYIYKTNLSKNSGVPSQFDFLKVSNQRGLLRTSNDKTLYRNLMVGAQGEQYMVDMLKKSGRRIVFILLNTKVKKPRPLSLLKTTPKRQRLCWKN